MLEFAVSPVGGEGGPPPQAPAARSIAGPSWWQMSRARPISKRVHGRSRPGERLPPEPGGTAVDDREREPRAVAQLAEDARTSCRGVAGSCARVWTATCSSSGRADEPDLVGAELLGDRGQTSRQVLGGLGLGQAAGECLEPAVRPRRIASPASVSVARKAASRSSAAAGGGSARRIDGRPMA